VLVSAFAFGGIPKKAVQKAFSEADIYVSPALLREYRDVPLELITEGKIDQLQLKALIAGIAAFVTKAKVVNPQKKFIICRDPEDRLDAAFKVAGEALKKSRLTMKEVDNAVKTVRRKTYAKMK